MWVGMSAKIQNFLILMKTGVPVIFGLVNLNLQLGFVNSQRGWLSRPRCVGGRAARPLGWWSHLVGEVQSRLATPGGEEGPPFRAGSRSCAQYFVYSEKESLSCCKSTANFAGWDNSITLEFYFITFSQLVCIDKHCIKFLIALCVVVTELILQTVYNILCSTIL